jgi:DNA-binding MarR family transcriptional regulator
VTANGTDTERRQAWRDVFEAHAAVMEVLAAELKHELGLSITEYDVLLHLSEGAPPVRMHELADAVVLSKSGLTRVVDRMEGEGLLARVPIPGDRRSTAIALTPAGEELFKDARALHRRGIKQHFTDHLTERDAAVIRRVFSRARDAALAQRDGPAAPAAAGAEQSG